MAKEKGIIYVCSTIIPGLIKIGKAESDRFEERMRFLESNGYRNCTGLKRQFAIEVDDYDQAEKDVDEIFKAHQVGNTELFACNIDKVIKALSRFNGKIIFPVNETKEEIVEKANEGIASSELPEGDYTFKSERKGYEGIMRVENGILTLLAGAKLAPLSTKAQNASPNWVATRMEMGIGACELSKDIDCSSVSEATFYVCGHGQNGWTAWIDKNGKSIDIYRNK